MFDLAPHTLAQIYLGLFGLAVLVYGILDGYDLGVGILLPMDNEQHRDTMIASIGPFWDANETWLVLAVGLLLIAFPTAHSMVLQALYIPASLMLLGLIIRGVAFDFRAKVKPVRKQLWDKAFKYGSLLTTLAQGYILGMYVTGLDNSWYAHLFGVMAAFGVTAAYLFIGACWLILKTSDELQQASYQWAKLGVYILSAGIVAVSVANLALHDFVLQLWFSAPWGLLLAAIPVACFGLLVLCKLILERLPKAGGQGEWLPFLIALLVFSLCFAGLGISYYPYVIPGILKIDEALAAPSSLTFLLVGALVVIPCILAYTVMVYRIFWGKAEKLSYY